ncbi:MAG: DUF6259 domain-containing protein [Candidatus Hydrogenedentota bacterium]
MCRCAIALTLFTVLAADALEIETESMRARFERGALVTLTDMAGRDFLRQADPPPALTIRRTGRDHSPGAAEVIAPWEPGKGARMRCNAFAGLPDAAAEIAFRPGPRGGIVVQPEARTGKAGVWGVEWPIARIPAEMDIIVPGRSGLRFTKDLPGMHHVLDYPMQWEAQMVIVQGENAGFWVWADDKEGSFKRLTITRTPDGWELGLASVNQAPFSKQQAAASPPWHIEVFEGDWRTPARIYRDYMQEHSTPTAVADQKPAWVKDIRCCVILGVQPDLLPLLAERLDPAQTLLYVARWREAGYDRMYPDYTARADLDAFIDAAHDAGFKVMLHVNYFGCDPKHPAYEQFKQYQIRDAWNEHEPLWWTWERADPPIKFAYINPAAKAWRDYFVAQMTGLTERHAVDALHLDQTLAIFNDHNGLVDGMNAAQGNVALHADLRKALPHIALSGEGLNEITCRHEAFAQRHVWGLAHFDEKVDMPWVKAAHPVSSYLLRPYTTIYGYLGMHPPTRGQLYSAWREAYRNFGVIPTLSHPPASMFHSEPTGFVRQFFEETAFWLDKRVDADTGAPWPPQVAFPFKTRRNVPVTWRNDGILNSRRYVVSATMQGVTSYAGEGHLPGWRVYDEQGMYGLDPGRWYPLFPYDERPANSLHLTTLPNGITLDVAAEHPGLALFRTRPSARARILLADELAKATTGSKPPAKDDEATEESEPEAKGAEARGALYSPDGAFFIAQGEDLHAHPPHKGMRGGIAYAQFALSLPWNARRFICGVGLAEGAFDDDCTDGVRFEVIAQAGDITRAKGKMVRCTGTIELGLGLRDLAGRDIMLELLVDAGPDNDPACDWARWYSPRIETEEDIDAEITIADVKGWQFLLMGDTVLRVPPATDPWTLPVSMPGTLYFTRKLPGLTPLPVHMHTLPMHTTFSNGSGWPLEGHPHTIAQWQPQKVEGKKAPALYMHPPNHGRTITDFALTPAGEAPMFRAAVGLGNKGGQVVCSVEANGREVARVELAQEGFQTIEADLAPWTNKPLVLSLVTDAGGPHQHDGTLWKSPRIVPAPPPPEEETNAHAAEESE